MSCFFTKKSKVMKKMEEKSSSGKLGLKKVGSGLPVFHAHAAGIDIGATFHCIAISDGVGGHEVNTVGSFTKDLESTVSYLLSNGITTVAMESTGVYWVRLYMLLEEAGIEPYLVNAQHVKNVTGRKQDDSDAVWIQRLHTCGLLRKSFQPDNETRVLRTYVRHRRKLIDLASDAVRRMQKALELLNIKLHHVISDILGKSGLLIVKAILSGERDASVLSKLCDRRIKATQQEVALSLEGIWDESYLFLLAQAVGSYEFYQTQIVECEGKISEQLLKQVAMVEQGDVTAALSNPSTTLIEEVVQILEEVVQTSVESEVTKKKKSKQKIVKAEQKKKKKKKNQFDSPIAAHLYGLTGVDLCKIPGISEVTALELIAEIGTDMSKWKNAKHFAAWLNLVPNTKVTGGKIISSKMTKKENKAGQCLRQAAATLANEKSSLGECYRTTRAKTGGKAAVIATAHKLARIIYQMLKSKTSYNPNSIHNNQQQTKQDKINKLEKILQRLKEAV
jgi:transposase